MYIEPAADYINYTCNFSGQSGMGEDGRKPHA